MKRSRFSEFLYVVFRKDIGRKIMALLLALVLWLYLDQKVVLRQPHQLPIRVVSGEDSFYQETQRVDEGFFIVIPESLMLMEPLEVKRLEIGLSGPKEMVQSKLIGRKDISPSDMGGLPQRKITFNLIREYFDPLKGSESIGVDFSPGQISMTLAKRESAEILLNPENVDFRGLEALREKGQDIESVSFNPTVITLEGPAPVIDEIERNKRDFKLMSMDLSYGKGKNQELRLSSEVREKQVSIQGRPFVDVKVDLKEEPAERVLKDVDILVYYGAFPLAPQDRARIELQQDKVNLHFTGPRSQIDFLLSDDKLRRKVMALVNLSDIQVEQGSKLSLDDIIEKKIASPYTFEIKVFTDSEFPLSPLVKVVPEQRGILVSRRAATP